MIVNETTKKAFRVKRNCPHWFVATSMRQSGKEMTGQFNLPVYTPTFTLGDFSCCVCGATAYQVREAIANEKAPTKGKK